MKGDKADAGNCRGMPLRAVCKTFCKFLIARMETMIEKADRISERQAMFRPNRSCVDHVYGRPTTQCGEMDCGESCGK